MRWVPGGPNGDGVSPITSKGRGSQTRVVWGVSFSIMQASLFKTGMPPSQRTARRAMCTRERWTLSILPSSSSPTNDSSVINCAWWLKSRKKRSRNTSLGWKPKRNIITLWIRGQCSVGGSGVRSTACAHPWIKPTEEAARRIGPDAREGADAGSPTWSHGGPCTCDGRATTPCFPRVICECSFWPRRCENRRPREFSGHSVTTAVGSSGRHVSQLWSLGPLRAWYRLSRERSAMRELWEDESLRSEVQINKKGHRNSAKRDPSRPQHAGRKGVPSGRRQRPRRERRGIRFWRQGNQSPANYCRADRERGHQRACRLRSHLQPDRTQGAGRATSARPGHWSPRMLPESVRVRRNQATRTLAVNDRGSRERFVTIDGPGQLILGREAAVSFGVLALPEPANVAHITDDETLKQQLSKAYPGVFNGVGKLKGVQAHLHVDPDVIPVAQKQRRVPFALEHKVKAKVTELLATDIIQEAEGPTPWVSPVVVAPKPNGEIRLCVDMRRANEAIIRERHPLPTIDEVIHSVNGSQVFSKIDLKWGFHQVELDEESRRVTTFAVLDRLFQYKRLAFGVSSAPELYQKLVRDLLKDLPGIQNAADDMVVHGRDRAEHDDRLHGLLQRLAANGITVNKDKCQFRQTSVIFFGLHLSAHGVKPTAATVSAMRDARVPSNPSEVRSFLGTAGFSARFIPDFATTADPLRKLTHTGAKFVWGPGEQQAFDRLKDQVATAAALAYFDPAAPTQVIADASPVGLGAVLVQRHDGIHRPIAYASRTLTPVERRYS